MKLNTLVSFFAVAILINTTILAKPDVSFADSVEKYNGAYLAHELEGDNIRFRMSEAGVPVELPVNSYNLAALRLFTKNIYQFSDSTLKADFVKMLYMSFESAFEAVPFLEELNLLLGQFAEQYPEHVH